MSIRFQGTTINWRAKRMCTYTRVLSSPFTFHCHSKVNSLHDVAMTWSTTNSMIFGTIVQFTVVYKHSKTQDCDSLHLNNPPLYISYYTSYTSYYPHNQINQITHSTHQHQLRVDTTITTFMNTVQFITSAFTSVLHTPFTSWHFQSCTIIPSLTTFNLHWCSSNIFTLFTLFITAYYFLWFEAPSCVISTFGPSVGNRWPTFLLLSPSLNC